MTKSIAAVIPAYNASRYIIDALNSVYRQTRPPEEVIVVDDGSTDTTNQLARAWAAAHRPDLKLIQQDNRGLPGARNTGIRATKCDLIALLDADDLWLDNHLQSLEGGFRLSAEIVLCFGDSEVFRDGGDVIRTSKLAGTRIEKLAFRERDGIRFITESPFPALVGGSRIANCSTLFSRSAALSIGLYDESLRKIEDLDFWLRLCRIGPFAYVPRAVSRVRRHDANLTHPKGRLITRAYKLQVLEKTIAMREGLQLTLEEERLARTALSRTVRSLLYHASREGVVAYLNVCGKVLSRGYLHPLRAPKDWLRATLQSLPWRKTPSQEELGKATRSPSAS